MIGRNVNKAARLMCNYPGRVSCDQDTAYHSKLPMAHFELLEYKELKGIANPGKIYEFSNKDNVENNAVATYPYPILGRDAELRYFRDVLLKVQREFSDHLKVTNLTNASGGLGLSKETAVAKGIWMIVFEGETGIGKSRTLGSCMAEAERQNVKVFSVAMNLILSGQTLFGLSSLVMDAIGISELRSIQEREDFLRKRVTDAELAAELCVLNDGTDADA
jgi:adenylate cyclase 10